MNKKNDKALTKKESQSNVKNNLVAESNKIINPKQLSKENLSKQKIEKDDKLNKQKPKQTKQKAKKIKVLFVCTGNTCRSPMAEHLFKHYLKSKKKLSAFAVNSAGIFADANSFINPFAVSALAEFGIKVNQQKSKQLTEIMVKNADLIVCMSAGHKATIDDNSCVFSIGQLTGAGDVPDPYGHEAEKYLAVARYLQYACEDIFAAAKRLESKNN